MANRLVTFENVDRVRFSQIDVQDYPGVIGFPSVFSTILRTPLLSLTSHPLEVPPSLLSLKK
jgi:hypothetical protein